MQTYYSGWEEQPGCVRLLHTEMQIRGFHLTSLDWRKKKVDFKNVESMRDAPVSSLTTIRNQCIIISYVTGQIVTGCIHS